MLDGSSSALSHYMCEWSRVRVLVLMEPPDALSHMREQDCPAESGIVY